MASVRTDPLMASPSTEKLMRPRNTPISKAPSAPTLAASVGVVLPPRIEPSKETIKNKRQRKGQNNLAQQS